MPYIKIDPAEFYLQIPEQPGVYKLFSLNENDTPKHLQRVLGTDTAGILYIGKSNNLRDRLRMLWRVLNPDYNTRGHTFGVNNNSILIIREAFPLDTLAIDFEVQHDFHNYETLVIENYRQEFGEVPPLNGTK